MSHWAQQSVRNITVLHDMYKNDNVFILMHRKDFKMASDEFNPEKNRFADILVFGHTEKPVF